MTAFQSVILYGVEVWTNALGKEMYSKSLPQREASAEALSVHGLQASGLSDRGDHRSAYQRIEAMYLWKAELGKEIAMREERGKKWQLDTGSQHLDRVEPRRGRILPVTANDTCTIWEGL